MDRWLKTGFCRKRELSVEKPLAIEREDEVGSQASVSAVKTTTDDNVHVSRKTDNQLTKLGSKRCDLSSDSKKLKTDKTGFVDVGSLVAKPLSDAEKYNVLTKSWMPNELYIFPQGTRNLKFQKKWLSEFQWLVYSEEKEGAFCKFCFVFAKDTEVGKGQHVRLGSFVTSPFIRWKDAKEEFRRHEQNNYHQTSCVLAQHFLNVFEGKSDDICSQIDKGKKQKIEENRYKILPVIKTVIFCGRQEIALRGHDDSGRLNLSDLETNKNEGNFKALLKFRIDSGDIALKSHLENCKGNSSYTSPRIQNEIIDACGEIILQKLVQKINDAKCFAILADETTDIVGVEQFTLCARYIVKEEGHFVLKEDFLKFVPVQDTTGAGLSKKILTELGSIGVALSHLKGQGYDGASSMSGKYKGCAALIKEVHPEALYVHCSSHALNLVICHACEVPPVRNSLAIMKDIINFFRSSAKRNALLQEEILTEDPSAKRTRLLKFCETRWSEHLNTLVSFKELYPTIVKVLDRIQNEFDDADTSGKANMLSAAIRNGQFLISLCTATKLFCLTFGLTKYLQMKECDLSQALKYAENVRGEVQAMRENAESEFHRIFLEAQETAEEVGGTISMPRVIRKQTQRDNYETNNAEDYFRLSIFIPLMDFFLQEMEDRFLSHKSVLEKLSLLLPVHIRNVDSSVIESCSKVMSGQWPTVVDDPSMFEAELKMWKRTWIGENDCPTDFLSSLDQCNEGIFPTVHSMLKIAPSAKKLWGVEEPKDEPKGILSLNDHQMWRDSTWSSSEHAVSQPIMVTRRSGSFPGSEAGNILSPRSSETSGLGVKMVEYVLGTSPTNKDLEPQMRRLVMVRKPSNDPNDKKEKEKAPSSPYDTSNKKEHENGVVPQNGVQNGLDDDKGFNRTPGSRQPSPSDEELNKNNGVVVLENPHVPHHYPHQFPPPPPHPHNLAHLESHFEHAMALDGGFEGGQQASYNHPAQQQPTQQQQAVDSPTMLGTSFDVQVSSHDELQPTDILRLFRNQNTAAVNPAQQIQLLQQQQYQHLAATQQQQQLAGLAPAPGATFAPAAPYIINPQEPYVIAAGPTVMPQYYSMPWGVYPANIIQQGTTTQQRRPLTPSSASENPSNLPQVQPSQYQVIPTAYYDQSGSMVIRGISAGGPQTMRLVSPAPVLVNAATPGSSMRLLGSQTQQITTPPSSIYSGTQPASLYSTPTANGTTISGLPPQSASAAPGYSTNLASLTSSLSSLGAGLGLSTSSTGRRDSFDRNTSAFSPSLEYGRQKWPQNYSALGTVTASPSPLGLASGSVSPPPLGSSAGLQLGALTTSANRTLLSAAPGAEAMTKFRAAGTMLGTNSLFAKLGTVPRTLGGGGTSPLEAKPSGRSRLLEDFRNNRYPSLQLRDLANHIVEFSQDQHGSRFIQQKLERATVPEKQLVFTEIIAAAYNLMTDVFGNYVIQKFFEFGTADQKTTLAQKVRGHVLPLALQMYGCRVIQKALESISGEQQVEIVRELDGHVLKCVKDQNGNHVVQKCIECVDPHALQFIINAFQGQVFALSTHPYGCRVIQRILEHCTQEQTAPILEELHQHTDQLIQDQYGNYVIQHVLEHGKPEDKSLLIGAVRGKVLALSQHKFASNVVEKCVTHATRAERAVLIEEVCGFNDNALHVMMKDQYANYVVQKMLDVCEAAQRKVLMHKIRPHFASLRKYTYGKHIIAKLEKFFMKSNNVVSDLGPIGPPTNGVL